MLMLVLTLILLLILVDFETHGNINISLLEGCLWGGGDPLGYISESGFGTGNLPRFTFHMPYTRLRQHSRNAGTPRKVHYGPPPPKLRFLLCWDAMPPFFAPVLSPTALPLAPSSLVSRRHWWAAC